MAKHSPPIRPSVAGLPLGEMAWERFEAFAADLISRRPGYTNCHRHGQSGQRQRGIDIFAYKDGERWAFSNKRLKVYSRSHAEARIAETSYQASHYVILLSRIASPDVRAEIDKHPTWELWDSDDICRKVRDLAAPAPRRAANWWIITLAPFGVAISLGCPGNCCLSGSERCLPQLSRFNKVFPPFL